MTTEELQHLHKIRLDLLVWAGYHRGNSLREDAMPRFHEIMRDLETMLPDMVIVQGGTCWACGVYGNDMQWWHLALYDDDGKMIANQRMGYLIHKTKDCSRLAEEKATSEQFS